MPVKVRYNNDPDQECTIRPTPYVQVNSTLLKNKLGTFGTTYTITLTGTIIYDEGTPYALDPITELPYPQINGDAINSNPSVDLIGPYLQFDKAGLSQRKKPHRQRCTGPVGVDTPAQAIYSKQRALRALFAKDGQRLIVSDIFDDRGAAWFCNPRVVSIEFEEGQYISKCGYTIVLEADFLLFGEDDSAVVDIETRAGSLDPLYSDEERNLENIISAMGKVDFDSDPKGPSGSGLIEDFTESWSIEVDDSQGENSLLPRTYRITHDLSAVGKTAYDVDGNQLEPAWTQAKNYLLKRLGGLHEDPSGMYPNIMGKIGSGTIALVEAYEGFNHVRNENIDVTAGSFSINETWIMASGKSHEQYNASVSSSNTDPFITVQLDGTIKGLSQLQPSGYGDIITTQTSGAYRNAFDQWNQVSNSGKFGLTSDIFKRANNLVAPQLNSAPISVSIQTNEFTGDIGYSLSFNNRPQNFISGAISEQITINDTYPGDVFAVIPVLGRPTGPVLQYVGGRTEYIRDVQVNLTMDYTKIPYGSGRNPLLLKKPSVIEPTAHQLFNLISDLSPRGEPGVRKYFVSPPQETWNPKDGSYSFTIKFTYELDK